MSGYTVRYSVDTIEELLDNGFFDSPSNQGNLVLGIHELDVHYRYGNVGKKRYESLNRRLEEKLKNMKMGKYEDGKI